MRWTIPMLLIRDHRWCPSIWVDTEKGWNIDKYRVNAPSLSGAWAIAELLGHDLVAGDRTVEINLLGGCDREQVELSGWTTDHNHFILLNARVEGA